MIRPGEIDRADTADGKRSAVIVSREEWNRGRWVVAVLITSVHFPTRSTLPHCVPLRAGEFGLTKGGREHNGLGLRADLSGHLNHGYRYPAALRVRVRTSRNPSHTVSELPTKS